MNRPIHLTCLAALSLTLCISAVHAAPYADLLRQPAPEVEVPVSPDANSTYAPDARSTNSHCKAVKDAGLIVFRGRQLIETPDITEPELRRANVAISTRCFELSDSLLQTFAATHPDNYHVFFLHARFMWVNGNRERAEAIANNVLRGHPEFTSAKVLLASMAIDDHDYKRADQLLDEIERRQPTDLWAYIDRLRVDAQLTPSSKTLDVLRSIISDARFPPNARQQAAITARYEMPGLTQDMRDAIFDQQMATNSPNADCVLASQAESVIELRQDPVAGAKLIEKYLRKDDDCVATPLVRTLLAEAYLWQAAKLAAMPTAANQDLIKKAGDALDGDFNPVAQRFAFRPFLAPVWPLIKDSINIEQPDDNGLTVLCNSVLATNVAAVTAALDAGANPNAHCDDRSQVQHILFKATQEKVTERQQVLHVLLERGAKVEGLEFCASRNNGDCYQVLLPILQEFERQRAATRATF
jgi:hypothetical protein